MKAMVLKGPNTPFELTQVPDPVAGAGEAVARVIACGSGLTIQHIKAGADEVVDASDGNAAEALLDLTGGRGVDVVIDYVSTTPTLEAGAKALGIHGRLVTLGGAGQSFSVSSLALLLKEQDVLGSRFVTRSEILAAFDLVARGEVWPLVTDICPLEDAEALHARIEAGEVTGRAALLIG